jgi:[ribosomal protein S5]-alanine N-acetyltransferase
MDNLPMELTTPRLILREFCPDDYEALREFVSDPEICRFENSIPDETEIQARFQRILADREENPKVHYRFAITIRPENRARGWIKLTLNNRAIREYEIGWTVHRQDWGKGIATEAAQAVMAYAFKQLNSHRVVAFCNAENIASARVMQKLGMRREGLLRETLWLNQTWCDEWVYAILERDYFSPTLLANITPM